MLEKNDYPIEIGKIRKEILSVIGKKTVVQFQLVNSLSRVDRNGKRTYKRRHLIENVYTTFDKQGNTVEMRYYKNKRDKGRGGVSNISYTPEFSMFENKGKLIINVGENQDQNLDLVWFLWNHDRRAGNKDGTGSKRPLFYFIDENKEAIEFAQKMEAEAEMKKLLWHPKDRLGNEELETIAKALRVSNVDDMNIERVQTEIQKICGNTPQRFLNLRKVDKETKMRASIQKAQEIGILIFDNKKLEWSMLDGDKKATLCPVRKTDDQVSALIYFLKNNDDNDHIGRINEIIEESKMASVK
jgi:hypothetical protein